jgi:hypothetical protein
MSKACQYATNDNKVVASLKHVNVKNVQISLQKTITWTKKHEKGRWSGKRHVLKVDCNIENKKLW